MSISDNYKDASQESDFKAIKADGESSMEKYFERFSPEHKQQVLEVLLECLPGEKWFQPGSLVLLTVYRDDPITWGHIATVAKLRGIHPPQLEAAVDEYRRRQLDANTSVEQPTLNIINAETLLRKIFPPEKWVIDDMLPAGCTVLAGRSKDGKSLMAYGIAVAVATGGAAFGTTSVTQGDVLYLALEDGERRAQKRLKAQCSRVPGQVDLARLEIVPWEAPSLGDGLEAALRMWMDTKQDPRLIIIDILEKVRPRSSKSGNAYSEAYAATAPLTQLAQDWNIAILLVHHLNKIRSEDIRDAISGPMSLLGGADAFWILKRTAGEPDAALSIGGRDIAEQELALRFQDGFWTILGGAEQYRLSKTRQTILQHLSLMKGPQTPKQLSLELPEIGYHALKKTLQRMATDGQLLNHSGRYAINPSCDLSDLSDNVNPASGSVSGVSRVPHVSSVSQNVMNGLLKTQELEALGDSETAGTPDSSKPKLSPMCPSCGSSYDLIQDACGSYCLKCRQRNKEA